ncbi:MAG: Cna B-type domain-containing protein [Clostridia bacterium]|nr:Cna B-type domain-containing protein [Clostridia bacterium]
MKKMLKRMKPISVLMLVMLFMLSVICGAAAEGGAGQRGTNELDGSKIEGIYLEWVTEDSTLTAEGDPVPDSEFADKDHLYLSTTNNGEITMVYRIEAQFSGQYDYAPGDVTISIPAQVWPARAYIDGVGGVDSGSLQGTLEMPVPEAPSTKADFNWQLVDGQYVLTNTGTLSAASSVSIEVAIRGLNPIDIVDMSTCNDITAYCEVVTNQGNIISSRSMPINAQIDTTAKITYVEKEGEVFESAADVPQELLANLPAGANPDDYIYAKWRTYQAHQNNQPYSMDVEDMLSAAYEKVPDGSGGYTQQHVTDGIFLGSANYPGTVLTAGDVDFTTNVMQNQEDTTTRVQHEKSVYMWSAYLKSAFTVPDAMEDQRVYCLDNEVTWILTESDKEAQAWDTTDPQKVERLSDKVSIQYSPMKWQVPPGHFIVRKWTEKRDYKDWDYGLGLTALELGREVDMNFLVETVGYGYPWTSKYSMPDAGPASSDEELEESYGLLGWRQVTEDYATYFNYENTELTSEDFEFKSLRLTKPSLMRYLKRSSGSFGYEYDSSLHVPTLSVDVRIDGGSEWHNAAVVEHKNGRFEAVSTNSGTSWNSVANTLYFADNVTDVRWSYVSNVSAEGVGEEKCGLGGLIWDVYPTITLKPSDRVKAIVQELFTDTQNPMTKFKNDAKMDAYGWVTPENDGEHVADFADASRATVYGAGYGVSLTKDAEYEGDSDNQRVVIHYTVTLTEQSNMESLEEYRTAVETGAIPAETSGIWYDLLPPHVTPMTNTVKLRSGDTIRNVYAIENYKNTGRYLLVVEADLTPVPQNDNNKVPYYDAPQMTFDAFYTVLDLEEYGSKLVNYAAFESTVDNLRFDTLGTIPGQRGEPDDPTAGNNATTPSIPQDIVDALTDLDPATDENRFVYAKTEHEVSMLAYAVSALKKMVRNDLVGVWTQGLDGQEQVTVFEGHPYTYNLTVSTAASSVAKDIVLYDTIENYIIPDPNQEDDTDATKAADFGHVQERKDWQGDWLNEGQWRGTLERVELGEFVAAGIRPVLLYSTIDHLQFADTKSGTDDDNYDEDTDILSSGSYDITDRTIWTVAEGLTEDGVWTVPEGVNVTAIAIDASLKADGEPFILMPEEKLTAYLRMRAPDDNSDQNVWNAKGAYARLTDESGSYLLDDAGHQQIDWEAAQNPENNMYAFNNSRVRLTEGNVLDMIIKWLSAQRMIRNDYTRVGIVPATLKVEKEWLDQENHDGIRPESVVVSVLRKVAGTTDAPAPVLDAAGNPIRVTLDESNNWTQTILQMDIVDEEGRRYLYSMEEEPVPGYEARVEYDGESTYTVKNIHPDEMVDLSGRKVWEDDGNAYGVRPEAVILHLYRDGEKIMTRTVRTDGTDAWAYSFGELPRFERGGQHEYVYEVREEYVPKYGTVVEGTQVTNSYIPYGDLRILKKLEGATSVAASKDFTFTLILLEEKADENASDKPLEGQYACTICNENDEIVKDGFTCGNGSTFTLKGGQYMVIHDLPSEARYEVIEAELDGFTCAVENGSGVIMGGDRSVEVTFTNTYKASGSVQVELDKKLTGRAIQKNKFKFELVDNNPDSDTYGEVIGSTRVQRPEEDAEGGAGTNQSIESQARILFSSLRFTAGDHGKTFHYILREANDSLPGYTSDKTEFHVEVTVQDNGDGTMSVTYVIKDAGGAKVSEPKFENSYAATGSVELKVWKTLTGRALEDGEFTFELLPCDENGVPDESDTPLTATNNADGVAVFAALNFTQDDVNADPSVPAVYYYLVRERAGEDNTVVYSTQQYLFRITVMDNGDGTLSFEQSVYALTDGSVSSTPVVPVFKNTVKPGALTVEKQVEGDEGDPDQVFTFKVRLTGESIGELDYNLKTPAPPTPEATPEPTPKPDTPTATTPAPVNSSKHYHASEAELAGEAYAMLELETGVLTIFRSTNRTDPDGNSFSAYDRWGSYVDAKSSDKRVYFHARENATTVDNATWKDYVTQIKEIVMLGAYKPLLLNSYCKGMTNLVKVDFSKMDTSRCTGMSSMFNGCKNIENLDLSTFDTCSLKYAPLMFSNFSYDGVLDLSSFNTSNLTSMYCMFQYATLGGLNVSTFDTSSVTSFYGAFGSLKGISKLDLSHFNTSSVTDMSHAFSDSEIEELDISGFTVESCTSAQYMMDDSSVHTVHMGAFNSRERLADNKINMYMLFPSGSAVQKVTIGADTVCPTPAPASVPSYPVPPTSGGYDGKWVLENDPAQVLTSKELFTEGGHPGTWVWHEAGYRLSFLPGDQGSGSMPDAFPTMSDPYTFAHTFYSATHEVTGFKDDNGREYALNEDGTCTIPANQYTADSVVTLTAQWKEKEAPVTITDDTVTIRLKAGESITLNNLPAGTAYEVWEELPAGWILIEKVNETGEIEPLETHEAVFTNRYDPEKVSVTLRAQKLLDGEGAAADQFSFSLSDDTGVLQIKKNAGGGAVTFNTFTYTEEGEHTYTIREVRGDNDAFTYDSAVYTVTVNVTKADDGSLSAAVSYAKGTEQADALEFVNTTKPGSLKLTKAIDGGLTDKAREKEFTFEITFTDAAFNPWNGEIGVDGSEEKLTVSGGKATVTLKGGESITLTDIPAGLTYSVQETGDLTGWTLDGTVNGEGQILPDQTAECTVTNTYSASGSVFLRINKVLTGRDLQLSEFDFLLKEAEVAADGSVTEGVLVSEASSGADGVVSFAPIAYTAEGEYTYVITEKPGEDETVDYSDRRILVTVNVQDEDGNGKLTCTPVYQMETEDGAWEDGSQITNAVKTGHLSIRKEVVSSYEGHADQKFAFTITLKNADGTPYTGAYDTAAEGGKTIPVTGGKVSVELAGGETATLYNLPMGTQYAVEETKASGFVTEAEHADGVIDGDTTAQAVFTNTYHAKGEYVPGAVKNLTSETKELEAGMFTFVLVAPDGSESTAVNDADGNVVFAKMTFDETDVGTKTLTIRERNDGKPGYTYDEDEITITLTITDNGDGTLTVEDSLDGELPAFDNTFVNETSISVEKRWQDNENLMGARPASITLDLYRNRVKLDDMTVQIDGTPDWSYTYEHLPAEDEDGNAYTYEVRERSVPLYQSSRTSEDGKIIITNTLHTLGELEVTKTVVGGDEEKAFTFTVILTQDGAPAAGLPLILEKNGEYANMATGEDGSVSFTLKHGETMKLRGLPYGVGYAVEEAPEAGYTVTYTDAQGTVKAGTLHQAQFTNTYDAAGSIVFGGTKHMTGRELHEDDVFTFELLDEDGDVIGTATQNPDGSYCFEAIAYTLADVGEYTYTVKEVIPEEAQRADGVTYDDTVYTIDVVVADNGDGTLNVTASCDTEALDFTNTYSAAGEVAFSGSKTLTGGELVAGDFSFTLYDSEGNDIETVPNAEDGSFAFAALTYTQEDVGTHTYTIREDEGGMDDVSYDDAEYTVVVTVTDNGDGTLNAAYVITKDDEETEEITFVNTVLTSLTISKTVEGCETDETFGFIVRLYDAEGVENTNTYAYTGDVEGELTSGDTIRLGHGQSVTIVGLPVGTVYSVEEEDPDAYIVTVNGNDGNTAEDTLSEDENVVAFVNTMQTTSFTVTKRWQGSHGGVISLTLYANGVKMEPQPTCTRNGDVYTFIDLPMYDGDGNVIVYSAKERYMDGYVTIYKNVAPYDGETKSVYDGGTIINKETVEADFAVRKKWIGLNNGEQPPAIELVLYCNGVATDVKTPKPTSGGWYKYYNLPRMVNGEIAVYTAKEKPVPGFMTHYELRDGTESDHADNGGTITNSKIPQTGDKSSLALWLTLMGASAVMMLTLMKRRRA